MMKNTNTTTTKTKTNTNTSDLGRLGGAKGGRPLRYEIRIPMVGVFHSATLDAARKRANRERNKVAREINGPAPHAAIFLGKDRVDYLA